MTEAREKASRSGELIAHIRESDGAEQPLQAHGQGVARIAEENAIPLGLPNAGRLLGRIHDWGKAGAAFLGYLRSAAGLIDQDADDYVDAARLKGKIDHSTAAAQWVFRTSPDLGFATARQVLALCLCSHHSGLIDCLDASGKDVFALRMDKADAKTHLSEVLATLDKREVEAATADLGIKGSG